MLVTNIYMFICSFVHLKIRLIMSHEYFVIFLLKMKIIKKNELLKKMKIIKKNE
jgi:hypothetical protein